MDVYYKEENHSYYLVGVKQSDIKFEKGRNVIVEEAYARILVNEKMIQPGQSRADLEILDLNSSCLSIKMISLSMRRMVRFIQSDWFQELCQSKETI